MALTRSTQLKWNHGLRREALVERLLGDILARRFQTGQRLVAQDLADQYGVSQTPIREALITLAGVGIIDLLPNRGAIVRRLSPRDIVEVCQVRRALECEAIRSACLNSNRTDWTRWIETIQEFQRSLPHSSAEQIVKQAQELDNRLHDQIAQTAGNHLLMRELSRLKLLFRAYRDLSWGTVLRNDPNKRIPDERIPDEAQEHLAIVEALAAHDPARAIQAMADHITAGQRYWSAAMFGTMSELDDLIHPAS